MNQKEESYIEIQNQLRKQIQIKKLEQEIKLAAGVDLAYWKREEVEYAVCCIVVLDFQTKEVIETKDSVGIIEVPYIPSCLAFRELPLILKTVEKLQHTPDLYFFDGNGYLHPRHMGIATHASFYLHKPTIGIAKSYYKIEDTDFIMPEDEVGAYTDIVIQGEVYGRVLRTVKQVKPIFLSIGNEIDLSDATNLVLQFLTPESHIPAPTRLADLETHKKREEYKGNEHLFILQKK